MMYNQNNITKIMYEVNTKRKSKSTESCERERVRQNNNTLTERESEIFQE